MMQKVILINPPALKGYTNERTYSGGIGVSRKLKPFERDCVMITPIDILYTASVSERAGAEVGIIDLLVEKLSGEAAERICLQRIGHITDHTWIGIRLSMPSLPQDLSFANRMKELAPSAKVFVFGTVIMATLDHWIQECHADFVLFGEPEAFFDKVLLADDYRRVPGVISPKTYIPLSQDSLYDGEKNTSRYGSWIKVGNLSDLPMPAWHLLDLGKFVSDGDVTRLGVFVQASRGCPIGCNMCPYMLLEGKPWRSNDIESVVNEIEYLNQKWGIYHIRFRDPNFGFNRVYARELCEAIIKRGVKLEATVETSVEVLDEETLKLMRKAGITTITTGIETNDEACMSSIGQKIAVNEKLRAKLDICNKLGFHIYGTFCLGTPEENWDTVKKTWMFANELDVESGFTVMTPFPGTPMYWRAIEEGLLPKRMRYSDWNSYTSTMHTNYLTTRDLDMARLWSRLETIIPYRKKRVNGRIGLALFHIRHLAHYIVRQYCRTYVWVCRWQVKMRRETSAATTTAAVIK